MSRLYNIPEHKFGQNPSVGSSDETVWDGGALYPWQSTAQSLEVLSSNTNAAQDDAVAVGTGAWTVQVYGYDADYEPITEVATMDGTTPVALGLSYLRVYRVKVLTAGSGGANAGDILVRVAAAGDTLAMIQVGNNQTLMCAYTIRAGAYAQLKRFYVSSGKGKDAKASLFIRDFGGTFQLKKVINCYEGFVDFPFPDPMVLDPKTDVEIRAASSAGTAEVEAGFDLALDRGL